MGGIALTKEKKIGKSEDNRHVEEFENL